MPYLQAELVGNPYDHGGFLPNFKWLVKQGLIPSLPRLEFKSIAFDIDIKVNSDLDTYEGGQDMMIGNSMLNSSAAHKWMHTVHTRIAAMRGEAQREAAEDDRRYCLMYVFRKLASYPEHTQKKYFGSLTQKERPGGLQEQLALAMKETEASKQSKINKEFGMSKEEQERLQLGLMSGGSGGLPGGQPLSGTMQQGADGTWRRVEKVAGVDKKQQAMMAYMVEQQKQIAKEVMNEEQLAVFEKGVAEMESKVDIHEKQRAMQNSQVELSKLLSEEQATTIQERIQAAMKSYVAEHGNPNASDDSDQKKAGASGLDSDDDDSDEDSDSIGGSDSDEDDDPMAKQVKMITYMLEQQSKTAHEIMDAEQLQVYKQGAHGIQQAVTMQEKQAAMAAAKQKWHPLLSEAQQAQMDARMKEAVASYQAQK